MTSSDPKFEQVRNLLDLPDDDLMIETWTPQQKRDYLLAMVHRDISDLKNHGCGMHSATCTRIEKLERLRTWLFGGVAFLSATGAVILFLLYLVGAFRQAVHP